MATSDGTGTAWVTTNPPDETLVSDVPVEIREAKKAVQIRSDKEHSPYGTSGAGGEHLRGSAKWFYQEDFPTTRPDGETLLDEEDSGRGLVIPSTRVMYVYDDNASAWLKVKIDADGITDGSITGTKLARGAVGDASPYAIIQDLKAANTPAGAFTAGAWQTRTLNTKISDIGGIIQAVAGTGFRLVAGRYRIRASAPANQVNGHQVRLWNTTRSVTLGYGTSAYANSGMGNNTRSEVVAEFYISELTEISLQHRCASTKTTNGLGAPCASLGSEVYSVVEVWRM